MFIVPGLINTPLTVCAARGGGGVLPYKRVMGMCCWMGPHIHDRIDCQGVAFSIGLLEWGRTFSDFWGKTVLIIQYKLY